MSIVEDRRRIKMLSIRENRIETLNLREIGLMMDQEAIEEMKANELPEAFIEYQEKAGGLLDIYDFVMKMERNFFNLTVEEVNMWLTVNVRVLRKYSGILGSYYNIFANEILKWRELVLTKECIEKYYRG